MRGSTIPMVLLFQWMQPLAGPEGAAAILGAVVYALARLALLGLRETHGRDLDYLEEG